MTLPDPLSKTLISRSLQRAAFEAKLSFTDRRAHISFVDLMNNQQLSPEQLAILNWERRRKLVEHCARNIPFYRNKFKEIGFEAGDLKTDKDWARLPILEKSDIRSKPEAIVDPSYKLSDLPASTTGGTTGLPLKTFNDPKVHLSSMSWRMLNWWGLHPGDNSGYLYRAIPTGIRRTLGNAALLPTRRAYISAGQMMPTNMQEFCRVLEKIRPAYLVGYVGALEVFARHCEANNFRLPTLQALWTTASPLAPNLRNYFESLFECPAYTQYGSCEFYWIAAECQHKCGLHVGSDIRHVDVEIDDSAQTENSFGDLVISDLLNYAFPLLRYRVGDRGRIINRTCSCGIPFPLMDYVLGRITDTIHLRNGLSIPGEYWTTIFDDHTDVISAFQVYQKADLSIEIRYIKKVGRSANEAIQIVRRRLEKLPVGQNPIVMVEVREIPHRDGKIDFVVSEAFRGGGRN